MDVDDALALASLKTTVLSDQVTDNMLTMADGMERQSADSAPGSAPIISAGAQLREPSRPGVSRQDASRRVAAGGSEACP